MKRLSEITDRSPEPLKLVELCQDLRQRIFYHLKTIAPTLDPADFYRQVIILENSDYDSTPLNWPENVYLVRIAFNSNLSAGYHMSGIVIEGTERLLCFIDDHEGVEDHIDGPNIKKLKARFLTEKRIRNQYFKPEPTFVQSIQSPTLLVKEDCNQLQARAIVEWISNKKILGRKDVGFSAVMPLVDSALASLIQARSMMMTDKASAAAAWRADFFHPATVATREVPSQMKASVSRGSQTDAPIDNQELIFLNLITGFESVFDITTPEKRHQLGLSISVSRDGTGLCFEFRNRTKLVHERHQLKLRFDIKTKTLEMIYVAALQAMMQSWLTSQKTPMHVLPNGQNPALTIPIFEPKEPDKPSRLTELGDILTKIISPHDPIILQSVVSAALAAQIVNRLIDFERTIAQQCGDHGIFSSIFSDCPSRMSPDFYGDILGKINEDFNEIQIPYYLGVAEALELGTKSHRS